MSADYSQVELRLLAHIAGEDVLKEIFRRGEDVHTATACRVFGVTPDQIDPGMRSKAKMINYGIVYGLSAYGMADRLDIPQSEADEFIQRYLAGFPAVGRFIEQTIEQGTEHGYVSTLFGRRRQVPELRARRWELRKQGERFAVNMVIQGTAADIMKMAMVRCDRALSEAGLRSRLVLQIHDELLFEGPAEEADAGAADSRSGRWPTPTSSIRRWRSKPAAARTGCRPSDWGSLRLPLRGCAFSKRQREAFGKRRQPFPQGKREAFRRSAELEDEVVLLAAVARQQPHLAAGGAVGAGPAGDRQDAVAGVVERALDGDLPMPEKRGPHALPDPLGGREPGAEALVAADALGVRRR